jgi:Tol biopolymer transport system component
MIVTLKTNLLFSQEVNRQDFEPGIFFRKIRSIGYRYIEPHIEFSDTADNGKKYWTAAQYSEYRNDIKEAELSINSIEVNPDDLIYNIEKVIKFCMDNGIKYISLSLPDSVEMKNIDKELSFAADALKKTGIYILVEGIISRAEDNKDPELFIGKENVFTRTDTYELLESGIDAEQYMLRNRGDIRSVLYVFDSKGKYSEEGKSFDIDKINDCLLTCFRYARADEMIQTVCPLGSDAMKSAEDMFGIISGYKQRRDKTSSILEVYDISTGEIRVLHRFNRIIEAPNWLKNGDTILYNSEGCIWKYSISSDTEEKMDTGFCTSCNNDHVPSADNKEVAVSNMESQDGTFSSRIYRIPIGGGKPVLVTDGSPSFLHGWSNDGEEIAFCAFRPREATDSMSQKADGSPNGVNVDIYSASVSKGSERRLTDTKGYNDGPEYSPDDKEIWFNSTRDGLMQVFRMSRDGSNIEHVIKTERNDWFPHISPDSKKVVYISYSTRCAEPAEHLPNMQAELFLMNPDGTGRKLIADIFGGQGTINVNSWSPDSSKFAFVSYDAPEKTVNFQNEKKN